jgi:membrane-bound lytic murein transglycosylase B
MTAATTPSNSIKTLALAALLLFAGTAAAFAETTNAVPQTNARPTAAQAVQNPLPKLSRPNPAEAQLVLQRYADNTEVNTFIDDMVSRYDFDATALHTLFVSANYSPTIAKLVLPAPSPAIKNWQVYRARFLDSVRINAGVKFWLENRATLERAYQQYGVPPEVIVGIIGVETMYGRYMGNFRVLDALTTLTFDYPDTPNRTEREKTFRKNLEDYLIWTRNVQIDPTTVRGSYTGAIGIPQFLPSSIVQYAVDFEGNDHIDLRTSTADAIGSVAHFLSEHGWSAGQPVVWKISHDAGSLGIAQAAADGQPEPHWPLAQLLRAGMLLDEPGLDMIGEAATPVLVIDLPSPSEPTEYMLGLQNFYVLTRYNRSFFYALAVYQLGETVKARVDAQTLGMQAGHAPAQASQLNPGGARGANPGGSTPSASNGPAQAGKTPVDR